MTNPSNPSTRFDAEPNRDPITGATGAHPVGTGLGWLAARMAARDAWQKLAQLPAR